MEDFVSFDLAKKLKEKGFDEKCYTFYEYDSKEFYREESIPCCNSRSDDYAAPTISQVLKWLREEKKIHIEPCILADCDTDADGKIITYYTYWSFSITSIESGDMIYFEYEHVNDRKFDSFEYAALAGLKYALDNLI